jgi:hypothetical protein
MTRYLKKALIVTVITTSYLLNNSLCVLAEPTSPQRTATLEVVTLSSDHDQQVISATESLTEVEKLKINCNCMQSPVTYAASAVVRIEDKPITIALVPDSFRAEDIKTCPAQVPITALYNELIFSGILVSDKEGYFSGELQLVSKDEKNSKILLRVKDISGSPAVECPTPIQKASPSNVEKNKSDSSSESQNYSGVKRSDVAASRNTGTLGSESDSMQNSVQAQNIAPGSGAVALGDVAPPPQTAAAVNAIPVLNVREPSLVIPAAANVSATNVQAPCDSSAGILTHYLSTRECTGANTLTIPLGATSLIYNSIRSSDEVFGLVGWKFSFHEYIDLAGLFYMTAGDSKIMLTRNGQELKPTAITWGDFKFTVSGANILRDEISTGLRYTYSKIPASDSKHRLVSITNASNNSKIFGVNFNAAGAPISIEYQDKARQLKTATITRTATAIHIDYPDDTFKDATIKTNGTAIEIAKIDDIQIDYVHAANALGRKFPIAESIYYTASIIANNSKSHRFFSYDSLGHIKRIESRRFTKSNKAISLVTNVTYPKNTNYHFVITESPLGKSDNSYKLIGAHVLKVASVTPFGANAYRYGAAPDFELAKFWDASRQAWTIDVTKYEANEKIAIFPNSRITQTKSGNTYTTTIEDKTGAHVLSTSTLTFTGEGQYTKVDKSGTAETSTTFSKVSSVPNSWEQRTTTKVGTKVVADSQIKISDTRVEVKDNLSNANSTTEIMGKDSTTTYTAPNQPTYRNEVKQTESTFSKITQSQVFVDGALKGKSKTTATDVAGGVSVTNENFTPKDSSVYWEKSTTNSNTAEQKSSAKQEVMPSQPSW